MNTWQITTISGRTWYVQPEGSFRADEEVVVRAGMTKEEAMDVASSSGRGFIGEEEFQVWEWPSEK